MSRVVIFLAIITLLVANTWFHGAAAEDTTMEDIYKGEDDETPATTMLGNTSPTEDYMSTGHADEKEEDEEEDYVDTHPRIVYSSRIVAAKKPDEIESIENPAPLVDNSHTGYRMPSLFSFNGGEPFYLEKDPITGAFNFTTKLLPVKEDNKDHNLEESPLKNHKISEAEATSDDSYFDDEDEDDSLDRNDGALDSFGRPTNKEYPANTNDVNTHLRDPSNHKYHSSYNKFPLISSSYANTKLQGTASLNNRYQRPYTTSSTQSPSYYTIRPQPAFSTSTSKPPFRGTVKYSSNISYNTHNQGSLQTNNPSKPHHSSTEEKPVLESVGNYNPQKIKTQHNQQNWEIDEESLEDSDEGIHDHESDYESLREKYKQKTELERPAEENNEKQNFRPTEETSHSYVTTTTKTITTTTKSPIHIYPIKSTEQPYEYEGEEEIEEDYDTEAPTGFSLAELFGYGKPPARVEEKKPQKEEKIQEEQQQHNQQQDVILQQQKPNQFEKPPQVTTSQPAHESSVTSNQPTTIQEEFSSDDQNFVIDKNQNRDRPQTTLKTTTNKPLTSNKPSTSDKPLISNKFSTVYKPSTINKPSTTQVPNIIYSESNTVRPEKILKPVNAEYVIKQQSVKPPQSGDRGQDNSEAPTPDLASNPSENINTVTEVNQYSGRPGHFGGSPNYPNTGSSTHFEISTVKISPYGVYAEEPFRPIFGPIKTENKWPPLSQPVHQSQPPVHQNQPVNQPLIASPSKNVNTISVSSTNIGVASKPLVIGDPVQSKVPNESPSRWNYPYNELTETFFQLPFPQQQNQNTVPVANPPRIPGIEHPKPHLQTPPFIKITDGPDPKINQQQPKPIYSSDTSITIGSSVPSFSGIQNNNYHKPSSVSQFQDGFNPEWVDNGVKKKETGEGQVAFPDDRLDEGRLPPQIIKKPITTVSVSKESIPKEENVIQDLPPHTRPQQNKVGPFDIIQTLPNQQKPPGITHHIPQAVNQNEVVPPRTTIKEPAQDLVPPAMPGHLRQPPTSGGYPRPHWESHTPPQPHYYPRPSPSQPARPKLDTAPPHYVQNSPNFGSGYRVRPGSSSENSYQGNRPHHNSKNHNQDSKLPNILPQFRPNAKISHIHLDNGGRIQAHPHYIQRQPLLERPNRRPISTNGFMGHLHPPPPPPHRRVNRNDGPVTQDDLFSFEKYPPQPPVIQQRPLVHRRTGPQVTDVDGPLPPVATLQMMQHQQQGVFPKPVRARDDFPEANEELKPPFEVKYPSGSSLNEETSEKQPVFVVYPVNSSPHNYGGNSDNSGVVVGTRGPQRPIPPSDSDHSTLTSSEDIMNSGPLLPFASHNKNQKPVLQLASDKYDTAPSKINDPATSGPNNNNAGGPIKSDFPYPLERPDAFIDKEEVEENQESDVYERKRLDLEDKPIKSDHDFPLVDDEIQAEVHNSHDDRNEDDDDTEINIIPYLQDYMPFATKQPVTSTKSSFDKSITTAASNIIPLGSPINFAKPEKEISQNNQWTTINGIENTQEARVVNTAASENKIHSSSSSTSEPNRPAPISVVLKTVKPQSSTTRSPVTYSSSSSPFKITEYPKLSSTSSVNNIAVKPGHQHGLVGSGGSEFTVSAVMHTHPQKAPSNHRPADLSSSTQPPQLNFQAPFLASANIGATPTNQGWSVVGGRGPSNERMKPGTVDRADLDTKESKESDVKTDTDGDKNGETTNFDFENFRPQLFGGFKPIYDFPEENVEERSKYLQTTERQEKMLS